MVFMFVEHPTVLQVLFDIDGDGAPPVFANITPEVTLGMYAILFAAITPVIPALSKRIALKDVPPVVLLNIALL